MNPHGGTARARALAPAPVAGPPAAHFGFKVCVLGDGHTGKSNLLRCLRDYAPGKSQSRMAPLLPFAPNRCRQMYAMRDVLFDVLVEDAVTPLDDRRSACRLVADCAAAIVVFDITRRPSFEHVADWIRLCRSHCPHARSIIVGTRHHLKKRRCVSKAEARDLGAEHGCAYVELSVDVPPTAGGGGGDGGGANVAAVRAQLHEQVKFAVDTLALEVIQRMPDPPTYAALRGRKVRTLALYHDMDVLVAGSGPLLQASPKRGSLLPPSRDSQRSSGRGGGPFSRASTATTIEQKVVGRPAPPRDQWDGGGGYGTSGGYGASGGGGGGGYAAAASTRSSGSHYSRGDGAGDRGGNSDGDRRGAGSSRSQPQRRLHAQHNHRGQPQLGALSPHRAQLYGARRNSGGDAATRNGAAPREEEEEQRRRRSHGSGEYGGSGSGYGGGGGSSGGGGGATGPPPRYRQRRPPAVHAGPRDAW